MRRDKHLGYLQKKTSVLGRKLTAFTRSNGMKELLSKGIKSPGAMYRQLFPLYTISARIESTKS